MLPTSDLRPLISDPAPGLVVTGQIADGVIEAFEHVAHPWLLGVQWHPERLYELCDEHRRIWEGLVEAARVYRDRRLCGRHPQMKI